MWEVHIIKKPNSAKCRNSASSFYCRSLKIKSAFCSKLVVLHGKEVN